MSQVLSKKMEQTENKTKTNQINHKKRFACRFRVHCVRFVTCSSTALENTKGAQYAMYKPNAFVSFDNKAKKKKRKHKQDRKQSKHTNTHTRNFM